MGAVMVAGPRAMRLRLALVAIADNADDFGFAAPSIETIAAKAACDPRTAMRVVQQLEREGWMKVKRRVVDGRGSVYFVDVEKLGVVPDAKSRKSEWHLKFEQQMKRSEDARDKVSPVAKQDKQRADGSSPANGDGAASAKCEESGDTLSCVNLFLPQDSGDNSQGGQVTIHRDSGDKTAVPILKNQEPSCNPNNPHSPQGWGRADRDARGGFRDAIDLVMQSCDSSDRKLRKAISGALESAVRKSLQRGEPESPDAVAARMVNAWEEFCRNGKFMRYRPLPVSFFSQGLWASEVRWPWNQQLVRESRASSQAAVGMYVPSDQ